MALRFALISDIHGNVTALRAIIEDATRQGADEYWVLGDVFMPGPGTTEIFDLLDGVNTTVFIHGNWEGALAAIMAGMIDFDDPTDIYGARLTMFAHEGLGDSGVERATSWPMTVTRQVGGLTITASHNLPDKSGGMDLISDAPPANFDRLFEGGADIAVVGHTHAPMVRPGRSGVVINPGSAGVPAWFDDAARMARDVRVHYALLTIGDRGVDQIDSRAIEYDIDKELALARDAGLPYLELYTEQLTTGLAHTHDLPLLDDLNQRCGYAAEVRANWRN